MPSTPLITSPFLQSVLDTCTHTRQQCLDLIAASESHAISPSHPLTPSAQLELSKQQKLLYSYLAQLRGLNRDAILEVRRTKQLTAEARQEIDRLLLQLQNLYYEERHLRGEISACESYDHKYLSLPLVPLSTFLALHPDLDPTTSTTDEKSLMFARINHELAEREALEQQRQSLLKKKQGLIADNKKRKEDLASLDRELEGFIDAAKPIQKIFEKQY